MRAWARTLGRALRKAREDQVTLAAAGVAFYAFLSFFPAMLAALTVYGLVAEPGQVEQQLGSVSGGLPDEARQVLQGQLRSLAAGAQDALTVGLVASVLAAVWSASGGTAGLMQAINVAYGVREQRGFVRLRGTALLLTLGAIVFVVVSVALIAVLPVVLAQVGLGGGARAGIQLLRWALLLGFVLLALGVVYRFGADRSSPRSGWVTPGALLATLMWALGSAGFSLYVSWFGRYQKAYGAIAGVIVLLLWLYLSSYVVLLGAEVNAELERRGDSSGPQP